MRNVRKALAVLSVAAFSVTLSGQSTSTQQARQKPFEPQVGQAGKDVVWVPTPEVLVEKMLDLANVTPKDFLIDLGSGDGRTVIAAAKRGLRAEGIEYNPNMVELSRRNANAAGVGNRAIFREADLFETDFSSADVVTMFLLPSINMRLRPQILKMRPGTRIVTNTFTMEDWEADESATVENCTSWCTAHLWIVPAQIEGTWQFGSSTLTLTQKFQMLEGRLGSAAISAARLRGTSITFNVGDVKYTGSVNGKTMAGTMAGSRTGNWTATRR